MIILLTTLTAGVSELQQELQEMEKQEDKTYQKTQSQTEREESTTTETMTNTPEYTQDLYTAGGKGMWGGFCACPNGKIYPVSDGNSSCKKLMCAGGVTGSCYHQGGAWSGKAVTCGVKIPDNLKNFVNEQQKKHTETIKTMKTKIKILKTLIKIKDAKRIYVKKVNTKLKVKTRELLSCKAKSKTLVAKLKTCKNVYVKNSTKGGWGGKCTCPDGTTYEVSDGNSSCKTLACTGGTAVSCNKGGGPWSNNAVTCAPAVTGPFIGLAKVKQPARRRQEA